MKISPKSREPFVLLAGDLACFAVGLWLALYLRYLAVPDAHLWGMHALPFSILSIFWIFVFFIAGLYEKHTLFFKRKLALLLFNAQLANAGIAVAFFYISPSYGINPKTSLVLYFLVSSGLLFFWRLYGPELLALRSRDKAILIGSGEDMEELVREINQNPRYAFHFEAILKDDLSKLPETLEQSDASLIVADFQDSSVANDIATALHGKPLVRFVDAARLYEDIFDRMPLTLLKPNWAIENVDDASLWYSAMRRIFDIALSSVLGAISLIFYPFVWLAIKLEDGGPLFIRQERVGKNGKPIQLIKFRSMSGNEADSGEAALKSKKVVTRVGSFLRKTRIDELPQLWNILRGDFSLIGPRPELPALVAEYSATIPFYHLRHIITPGGSGWAQIYHDAHPHHGVDIAETRRKLSYDLYYLKNRSLILDLKIALKTIKTILSRSGA